MAPAEELRGILRVRSLPSGRDAASESIVSRLAEAGGPSVLAVLFFGSHKTGAAPSPESAYDFFIVVSEYSEFYRAFHRAGLYSGSPALASLLNVFLPPNLISAAFEHGGSRRLAKCAVVSARVFTREMTGTRRDHFLSARLFQSVEISFCRNPRIEDFVLEALAGAARRTRDWVKPWLPAAFGLEDFIRALFRISLAAEIKPEGTERGEALYLAQAEALGQIYRQVLDEAAEAGEIMVQGPDRFIFARPATRRECRKSRLFFARSKGRATVRWLKYRWTFEGWREYIARKIKRRGDERLLAYIREKKRPMIFLWPRLIRALRLRRREETRAGLHGGRP